MAYNAFTYPPSRAPWSREAAFQAIIGDVAGAAGCCRRFFFTSTRGSPSGHPTNDVRQERARARPAPSRTPERIPRIAQYVGVTGAIVRAHSGRTSIGTNAPPIAPNSTIPRYANAFACCAVRQTAVTHTPSKTRHAANATMT